MWLVFCLGNLDTVDFKAKAILFPSLFAVVFLCPASSKAEHVYPTDTSKTQTAIHKVSSAFDGTHVSTNSTYRDMNNTVQSCSPPSADQFTGGQSHNFTLHLQSLLLLQVPITDP